MLTPMGGKKRPIICLKRTLVVSPNKKCGFRLFAVDRYAILTIAF